MTVKMLMPKPRPSGYILELKSDVTKFKDWPQDLMAHFDEEVGMWIVTKQSQD